MSWELLALLTDYKALPSESDFECLEAGGICAVMSPSAPSWKFGKSARRRRLEAAPRRQRMLEKLMSFGTVLPFAPGEAIQRSDVPQLVAANAPIIASLSDRFRGQCQYQVTVSWAERRVLEKFRSAPEISALFSSDAVTGKAIAAAVVALADRLSRDMRAQLEVVAAEFVELPRDAAMILNGAVLLPSDLEMTLDGVLEAIDAIWPEGLTIRQIGPSPAVSFASLRLKRFTMREIERAISLLSLSQPLTVDAIRGRRQELLRATGADATSVRAAAEIAEAALRAGGSVKSLQIIDPWFEGRSVQPDLEAVA